MEITLLICGVPVPLHNGDTSPRQSNVQAVDDGVGRRSAPMVDFLDLSAFDSAAHNQNK